MREDWDVLQTKKRFEVHVPSLSCEELVRLSMRHSEQRSNVQLTRLFRLRDPLISIVFVLAYDAREELLNYYFKILELNGL